jgi:hypothetical protein
MRLLLLGSVGVARRKVFTIFRYLDEVLLMVNSQYGVSFGSFKPSYFSLWE